MDTPETVIVEPDPEQVKRFYAALDEFNRLIDEFESATDEIGKQLAEQALPALRKAKADMLRCQSYVTEPRKVNAETGERAHEPQRDNTADCSPFNNQD